MAGLSRGSKKGKLKEHDGKKKAEKKLREAIGGYLPKRPNPCGGDIESIKSDRFSQKGRHNDKKRKINGSEKTDMKDRNLGEVSSRKKRINGFTQNGASGSTRYTSRGSLGLHKMREKPDAHKELHQFLLRNPSLINNTESTGDAGIENRRSFVNGATAAVVAACLKPKSKGESEGGKEEEKFVSDNSEKACISGRKKRKIIELMKASRKGDAALHIHHTYQLYNEILRSNTDENANKATRVHGLVNRAIDFLKKPLKENDKHCCTSRLLQAALKRADSAQADELYAMTKDKKKVLTEALSFKKNIAFTKYGAKVWEYIFKGLKNNNEQQRLLNPLILIPALLVSYPKANEASSFEQIYSQLNSVHQAEALTAGMTTVQKFVDKELLDKVHVHRIIKGVCSCASEDQLQQLWSILAEGALHLCTTKDGVEVLCRLLGYATSKERKTIVKGVKKHILQFAMNAVDCPLCLRLLRTVDDSKLLNEAIIKELLTDIIKLTFDPYGHLVLLQILEKEGLCKYLSPYYKNLLEFPSPTSLKATRTRQDELRPSVLQGLVNAFVALPSTKSENLSIVSVLSDSYASRVFVETAKISSDLLSATIKAIKENLDDDEGKDVLLNNATCQRSLKVLMKKHEDYCLKTSCGEEMHLATWKIIKPHIKAFLESKGVFLVVEILKTAKQCTSDLVVEIKKELNEKLLDNVAKTLKSAGSSTAGIDILMELIN